ncbi:dockerin type I domain-containing protein [Marinobacter sp. UBA5687]|uniref:dockerin type I domain-containing protein n=1 Tax=Marinobacter sp. UBA5687 TaxID=1946823 RepID=UPI0039C96E96
MNGDGRVNGRDLSRLVLAILLGKATAPAYDIDGDGRISHHDLIALIRVLTSR